MQSAIVLEREVAHLSEQDFKKVFPEQYYNKYAVHEKIINFQSSLLGDHKNVTSVPSPAPVLTRGKSTPILSRNRTAAKVSRFDPPKEVIAKNKEKAKRMQKFVKELNNKLKVGPIVTEPKIRTPLAGFIDVPESVFERLKLIEDVKYQDKMQQIRERSRNARKYMNFVSRSKNNSISPSKLDFKMQRSIIGDSVESKSIPDFNLNPGLISAIPSSITYLEKMKQTTPVPYSQRLQRIVQHTRSQIIPLNPEDKHTQIRCIVAMNKSIKKLNGLKKQMDIEVRRNLNFSTSKKMTNAMSMNEGKKQRRKDLIAMTQKIRRQVDGIEPISHYEAAVAERALRLKIKQLKTS